MKILSIFTLDPAGVTSPAPETYAQMEALIDEMKREGVLLETGGVSPGSLELTVSRKNGAFSITDGPFAEAKEVVGGFALFESAGRNEAIALVKRFLGVAGDGTCLLHEVSLA